MSDRDEKRKREELRLKKRSLENELNLIKLELDRLDEYLQGRRE